MKMLDNLTVKVKALETAENIASEDNRVNQDAAIRMLFSPLGYHVLKNENPGLYEVVSKILLKQVESKTFQNPFLEFREIFDDLAKSLTPLGYRLLKNEKPELYEELVSMMHSDFIVYLASNIIQAIGENSPDSATDHS